MSKFVSQFEELEHIALDVDTAEDTSPMLAEEMDFEASEDFDGESDLVITLRGVVAMADIEAADGSEAWGLMAAQIRDVLLVHGVET
jgi:hypothetical protein